MILSNRLPSFICICFFLITVPDALSSINQSDIGHDDYLSLADSADYYLENEQWGPAEKVMERMLRAEPANPMNSMVMANLANAKICLNKFSEADQIADVVLAKAPDSARILNIKAKALIGSGRMSEAAGYLEKSIACDSVQTWPAEMLRAYSVQVGKPADALRYCKLLIASEPENPGYLCDTGDVMMMLHNYNDASDNYKKAIEHSEGTAPLYCKLLTALICSNDIEEANNIVNAALEKHATSGNLYALRSVIYQLQYQPSQAEAAKNLAKKYNADAQFLELFSTKKRN